MKKVFLSILTLLMCVGCSGVKFSTTDTYNMEYHDNFNILQLTDIHYNSATDKQEIETYITKVINETIKKVGTIDLIEITGDTFMLANSDDVTSFINFMDTFEIPYASIWGNHDREGKYNPNWLSEQLMNGKYSIYLEIDDDDPNKRSNFVINLIENVDVVWQLFNIDSGSQYYDSAVSPTFTYDFFREDTYEWLDSVSIDEVPSIAYYHIPQLDQDNAWDAIKNGTADFKYGFYKLETFGASTHAELSEEEFLSHHIVAAFAGHCHANDFTFTTKSGITYGLGVKTGKELYYGTTTINGQEMDLLGASLVTIKDKEGNYDLSHLYLNETADGDIVVWEEY